MTIGTRVDLIRAAFALECVCVCLCVLAIQSSVWLAHVLGVYV